MKISLNLATPASARERYALFWAIPATLLGLAGLVLIILFTDRSYREYRTVEKSVSEYQERENSLRARESALRRQLEEPKAQRFLHDVQFVNGLIQDKRITLTGLAADITQLLPPQVRLSALALAPDGQELAIRFVIAGKSTEAIERFLSSLEDSPHFKDVAIINGGFEEEGAGSELENIACSAHYLPGGNEKAGE